MAYINIDPLKNVRKNAHIWRGERALIWYNEALDGSFTIQIFYDFEDKKRHVFVEIFDKNQKVELRNVELPPDKYEALMKEVEFVEALFEKDKKLDYNSKPPH